MSMSMATEDPPRAQTHLLADPGVRRSLEDFVRRRVPSSEVDDVVQTVLCDALAAPARPTDPVEVKRWLLGIARHKVADHHRRSSRETAAELPDLPDAPPPVEERALLRWAEKQTSGTRDGQQTLAWMAREGEGEKLESIAAEEQVPAARVRQRVSRMRRWMKERWLAELAAAVSLTLVALLIAWLFRRDGDEVAPRPEPIPSAPRLEPSPPDTLDRARALRAEALRACDDAAWQRCLDGLDDAARLDPVGDGAPEVNEARERVRKALKAPPAPSSPAPTAEAPAPSPVLKAPPRSKEDAEPAPVLKAPPRKPEVKSAPAPRPTSTPILRKPGPDASKQVSPRREGPTSKKNLGEPLQDMK